MSHLAYMVTATQCCSTPLIGHDAKRTSSDAVVIKLFAPSLRLTPLQFKPKITAVLAACEMRCMNVRVNSFPRFVVLNAIVNNAMFLR